MNHRLPDWSMGYRPVYGGLQIFVNDDMAGAEVKRSFFERFFSRPWTPWKRTRFDPDAGGPAIPDGEVHRFAGTNKIFMNSRTKKVLEGELNERHIQNS